MFAKVQTAIPGCYELIPDNHQDRRGSFFKMFHHETFKKHGLCETFSEQFCSTSKKNVLRGLHFQTPPHDLVKLVHCVYGSVMDVLLDLRIGSPTYGRHLVFELSAEKPGVLYVAPGIAHGFYVRSDVAVLVYSASKEYAPQYDLGIRWDSAGIEWPSKLPILSDRDLRQPTLAEFKSPFRYEKKLVAENSLPAF